MQEHKEQTSQMQIADSNKMNINTDQNNNNHDWVTIIVLQNMIQLIYLNKVCASLFAL